MKTIFIFNDSRPTDLEPCFAALGEDACLLARVEFDGHTQQFFQYAFGCAHELPEGLEEGITIPLNTNRARMFAAYDRIYGAGNWMPLWIESPTQNEAWRAAMDLYRSRGGIPDTRDMRFSNAALARILEAVGAAASRAEPHTVH